MYGNTFIILLPGIHQVTATQPTQSRLQNVASAPQTTKSYVTDNHTTPLGPTRSRIQHPALTVTQPTQSHIAQFYTLTTPQNAALGAVYLGQTYLAQGNAQPLATEPIFLDSLPNDAPPLELI